MEGNKNHKVRKPALVPHNKIEEKKSQMLLAIEREPLVMAKRNWQELQSVSIDGVKTFCFSTKLVSEEYLADRVKTKPGTAKTT